MAIMSDQFSRGAPTAYAAPTPAARSHLAPARRERLVQIGLGALWLTDGVLQLQPVMFTRHFVTAVLLPSASGNPAAVAAPITALGTVIEPHVALFNAAFAVVQLAIGALLLARRAVRATLAASLVWVAGVWWLAEGFGGLLTGSASPLSGAPGAVALYGIAALLAFPAPAPEAVPGSHGTVRIGLLPLRAARAAVAGVWLLGAALLVQPANLAPHALSGQLAAAAGGEPHWLAGPIAWLAATIGSAGRPVSVALAAVMALVGLGLLAPRATRLAVAVASALALLIWFFAQALGGIATGSATDPNSGPLLILLALSLSGLTRSASPAPEPLAATATRCRAAA